MSERRSYRGKITSVELSRLLRRRLALTREPRKRAISMLLEVQRILGRVLSE